MVKSIKLCYNKVRYTYVYNRKDGYMKHITKSLLLSGATLGGLVGQAQADTIVYNNTMQAETNETTPIVNDNSSEKEIQQLAYDNYVNQLRGRYPWIKLGSGTLMDPKAGLETLKGLEDTFKRIDQLRNEVSQARTELAKRNIKPDVVRDTATLSDIQDKVNEFDQKVRKLKTDLSETPTIQADNTLERMITEINLEIAKASETLNHSEDGIVGNLDKIHRKANDSKTVGTIKSTDGDKPGVVINTTETQKVNVVETIRDVQSDAVVQTIGEASKKRQDALTAISAAMVENQKQTVKSDIYKDNALSNIDDINAWLQKEQTRADNIQSEIEKNMTAAKSMTDIKADIKAKFDEAERLIKTSGKSQKMIDKMLTSLNEARAQLEKSSIQQNKTVTLDGAKNVDFGDIGRDKAAITAIAKSASASVDGRVDSALATLRSDNQAAQAKVDAWKEKTVATVDNYLDKIRKGKMGGQVDAEWLKTRKIYQTNNGNYRSFITDAMSLTESDTNGVLTKEGNLWLTNGNVPTHKVAAALYNEKSKLGLDAGFGSVMLPSDNINDFATVEGRKLANSQSFDGGAEGILNAINDKMRLTKIGGPTYNTLPTIQDIRNQHIAAVGNGKVFLVVSDKPTATFKLADSFLYIDKDGNPKTTDITVKLTLKDASGNELGERDVNGGRTHTKYYFYMSVDAAVGKLVVGAGYTNTWDNGASTGYQGGGGSSAGGELALGKDSDSSDSRTLQDWLNSYNYFFPTVTEGNDYNGSGLSLSIDTKVNPVAGEFAENTPLYIADIDDNQSVSTSGDVVINSASAPTYKGSGIVTTTADASPAHNHNVDLNSKAIMTTANKPITITRQSASDSTYENIDISLFSPWGVIGAAPKMNLGVVNHTVNTFGISDPSAVGHTSGKYQVKKLVRALKPKDGPLPSSANLSTLNVTIPTKSDSVDSTPEKQGAYGTSIVVRQLTDKLKRAGSGNSLVVRPLTSDKRAGSGNSLVVRPLNSDKRAGSGNSLVVRQGDKLTKLAGSGNTLIVREVKSSASDASEPGVRSLQGLVKEQAKPQADGNVSLALKQISSPVSVNKETVTLDVYVDPSLSKVATEALHDWQVALAQHGITLNVTNNPNLKGKGLAILDSDNVTTRAGRTLESKNVSNDSIFEMKGLAGLTTVTKQVGIMDLDSDDKLNRAGTFSVSNLRNTKMVVQVNTDSITEESDLKKVIKHELGHVFGLNHNDKDPLMTTYYSDKIFTGEITAETAGQVAANLRGGKLCECMACSGFKQA